MSPKPTNPPSSPRRATPGRELPGVGESAGSANGGGARLSRDAFATEFKAASRPLWCIAAAVIGDRTRAEDVVQDAALAAMQKLEEFEPGTSFLAWMGRFVRYTALNEARRQRTRAAGSLDSVDVPGNTPGRGAGATPEVSSRGQLVADGGSFDDQVLGALNMLDETARACLLLRTVHGMSYREISLALDVPEGTAMSHVHRARQAMRSKLTEQHGPRTSGRNS